MNRKSRLPDPEEQERGDEDDAQGTGDQAGLGVSPVERD
jgi:hypothetical protein